MGREITRAKILASDLIGTTDPTLVVSAARNDHVEIATGTICNVGQQHCLATVELVPNGSTPDGTHVVLVEDLNSTDTIALDEVIGGALLGPHDAIYVTASSADSLCVVVTGKVTV